MPEGIGYDIPAASALAGQSQGTPPAVAQAQQPPAEAQANQQKWYQRLVEMQNDPEQMLMLFQMGTALAQGPQYGQPMMGHVLSSVGEGLQFRGRVAEARRTQEEERRKAGLEEREQALAEQESAATAERQRAETELAERQEERVAGREPLERRRLAAQADYYSRRATSEGKGGVTAARISKLAQALYTEQKELYPTLDAAYIRASEMVETNLTRDKFIADYVAKTVPNAQMLGKTPDQVYAEANALADQIFGPQASPAAPSPAAGAGATAKPSHQDNPAVWKRIANDPEAREEANARFGKATVDELIRRHTGPAALPGGEGIAP